MASTTALQFKNPKASPISSCRSDSNPSNLSKITQKPLSFTAKRTITVAAIVLAIQPVFRSKPSPAISLDFRFTVPDLTPQEAEIGIRVHAQELLQIKELIDLQLWREVQKSLRESSGYLRQDLYTIIQSKPGDQRPQLRKLYSKLFNSVTGVSFRPVFRQSG